MLRSPTVTTPKPATLREKEGIRRVLLIGAAAFLLLLLCFRAEVRGDGVAYYSYLPAVIAYRTIDLTQPFNAFLHTNTPLYPANLERRLPNGMAGNYKTIGSALMALPFYLVAYVIDLLLPGNHNPDIGAEFQLAYTAASLFYAVLALVLIFLFLRRMFSLQSSALAIAGVLFATPLFAYTFFEASYSHTFSICAITAFALYLYATRERRRLHQWFIAGLLGGLLTLTHAQEVLYVGLVAAEAAYQIWKRSWKPAAIGGYIAFGLAALLIALPQLVIDKVYYGRLLPKGAPDITFDFTHPHLLAILFSTHHGWLSWSPLVVVALLGIPWVVRRFEWFGLGLAVIGLGQLLLNASLSDWWGGLAFGSRRMTDQTLLLALGLAAVCTYLFRRRLAVVAYGLVAVGIAWTFVLMAQYYYLIKTDYGPSTRDFLFDQLKALRYLPHLFIQGTVIRDLARGAWAGALGNGIVLLAVLIAAWALGFWLLRRRRLELPPGLA
jgi:hypothetical protein